MSVDLQGTRVVQDTRILGVMLVELGRQSTILCSDDDVCMIEMSFGKQG
jgi:hypothetical protein